MNRMGSGGGRRGKGGNLRGEAQGIDSVGDVSPDGGCEARGGEQGEGKGLEFHGGGCLVLLGPV